MKRKLAVQWVVVYQPAEGSARRVLDTSSAGYGHKLGREMIAEGKATAYSIARYTAHMMRGAVPAA